MNPRVRIHQPEQLDNLSLSGASLEKALYSLRLINRFFGNHRQLGNVIVKYCRSNSFEQPLHIVDLGCGGGDCIRYISKRLKKHKIKASFTGIDGNATSVSYARQHNEHNRNINFIVANIIDSDFKIPDCDILISSHFIYHFKDKELIYFLKKAQLKEIKLIIFSELYRSKIAYQLFNIISRILPISDMAKADGLLAIQRAFSIPELKHLIQRSDIQTFHITKKPFFRSITKLYPNS